MQFVDLRRQYHQYKSRIDLAVQRVLDGAQYINGPEVEELEGILKGYVGAHAVAVGSGTEALQMALMALGIGQGDEVITTPFTWISPAEAIALVGATPVFVDIEPDTFNLDPSKVAKAITSKTKAIIAVSLFGQMADFKGITEAAAGLPVIEDGAQSFGAEQNGIKSGAITDLAITSFFPAKPFGCYGDGGALFVRDQEVAQKMRAIRNHGCKSPYHHEFVGMTGRLDTLQAAILLAKWPDFERELEARRQVAARYDLALSDVCTTPPIRKGNTSTYAQYTIRTAKRQEVAEALAGAQIPYGIYYAKPLYRQPVFARLGCAEGDFSVTERACQEVISLPMHPWLSAEEQDRVIEVVRRVCDH
ncbi:MAG: DegT/DnrJ/EryC1/StrS family aminotransferase [Parachlamydiales bacterium]